MRYIHASLGAGFFFIIFLILALIIPGKGSSRDVEIVLTISTFLFAILAGFFISRLGSRYDQMRQFVKSTNLNDELTVNLADFAIFMARWLDECNDCNSWCNGCDFDKDGSPDLSDLAKIFKEWLQ